MSPLHRFPLNSQILFGECCNLLCNTEQSSLSVSSLPVAHCLRSPCEFKVRCSKFKVQSSIAEFDVSDFNRLFVPSVSSSHLGFPPALALPHTLAPPQTPPRNAEDCCRLELGIWSFPGAPDLRSAFDVGGWILVLGILITVAPPVALLLRLCCGSDLNSVSYLPICCGCCGSGGGKGGHKGSPPLKRFTARILDVRLTWRIWRS